MQANIKEEFQEAENIWWYQDMKDMAELTRESEQKLHCYYRLQREDETLQDFAAEVEPLDGIKYFGENHPIPQNRGVFKLNRRFCFTALGFRLVKNGDKIILETITEGKETYERLISVINEYLVKKVNKYFSKRQKRYSIPLITNFNSKLPFNFGF